MWEAVPKKDRITLPSGVKIEEIIEAFEKKHEAIKDWFFSGRGRELQYWDSVVAVRILLKLAAEGVACLPVHDSFVVSEPNARGLRYVMNEAFFEVTGRYPKMDTKPTLTEENEERGLEAMEANYEWKTDDRGGFSDEFRLKYSVYVGSIEEWRNLTGRSNIFVYSEDEEVQQGDIRVTIIPYSQSPPKQSSSTGRVKEPCVTSLQRALPCRDSDPH